MKMIDREHCSGFWWIKPDKCAICGGDNLKKKKKSLYVDHDHTYNEVKYHQVRGLLCIHCNDGLGKFKDNVDSINTARTYLEKR